MAHKIHCSDTACHSCGGCGGSCAVPRPASIHRAEDHGSAPWPAVLKLAPEEGECYHNTDLLLTAGCAALIQPAFQRFLRGRTVLALCPALNSDADTEKLTRILSGGSVRTVTILRMDSPCCQPLRQMLRTALEASGKFIPWQVVTLDRSGDLVD